MANELLEAAKELLNDFDLYGNPIQLRVIAKLRRATEAAQQITAGDVACTCGKSILGEIDADVPCPIEWHNPPHA